jgi:hypothetical protein
VQHRCGSILLVVAVAATGCGSSAAESTSMGNRSDTGLDAAFDGVGDAPGERDSADASDDDSCGKSCLGAACVGGRCQPIVVVEGISFPNWDGIYPWSLVLSGDSLYYSDSALGSGLVWKVPKLGGVAEPVFPVDGQSAATEYCLGAGGGEGARWLTAQPGHVYWHGCSNRLRDLDLQTDSVNRIGEVELDHMASTATEIFGTRRTQGPTPMGEIAAFALLDGTARTIVSYAGSPSQLAVDGTNVYWSDASGIMSVPESGGDYGLLAPSAGAQGVAVDDTSVYWTNAALGTVSRIAKTGGAVQTIADQQDTPVEIIVDGDFVYWTNTPDLGLGSVMRAPKTGGAAVELASGGGTMASAHRGPWALAVDDVAVYWSEIFGKGAVMKVAK